MNRKSPFPFRPGTPLPPVPPVLADGVELSIKITRSVQKEIKMTINTGNRVLTAMDILSVLVDSAKNYLDTCIRQMTMIVDPNRRTEPEPEHEPEKGPLTQNDPTETTP